MLSLVRCRGDFWLIALMFVALDGCSSAGQAVHPGNAAGAGTGGSLGAAGNGAGGATGAGAPGAAGVNAGSAGLGGTMELGGSVSNGGTGAGSPEAGAGSGGSAGDSVQAGGMSGSSGASGGGGAVGPRPAKVLIYAIATGFDHTSIPAAAMAIAKAATDAALSVDVVPPNVTTSNNTVAVPEDFTPEALSAYGAVVLLSTSGQPLGSPGTPQIKALDDFVTAGGGLVAINNATHAYDTSTTYISLLGADFNGQTPYGPGTCAPIGTHPSVSALPAMFDINDEIYNFKNVNPDIQVVLACKDSPTAAARPVSWVRNQGTGRVFFTALGKQDHSWLPPEPLVPLHVLPGLLWTMRR